MFDGIEQCFVYACHQSSNSQKATIGNHRDWGRDSCAEIQAHLHTRTTTIPCGLPHCGRKGPWELLQPPLAASSTHTTGLPADIWSMMSRLRPPRGPPRWPYQSEQSIYAILSRTNPPEMYKDVFSIVKKVVKKAFWREHASRRTDLILTNQELSKL